MIFKYSLFIIVTMCSLLNLHDPVSGQLEVMLGERQVNINSLSIAGSSLSPDNIFLVNNQTLKLITVPGGSRQEHTLLSVSTLSDRNENNVSQKTTIILNRFTFNNVLFRREEQMYSSDTNKPKLTSSQFELRWMVCWSNLALLLLGNSQV